MAGTPFTPGGFSGSAGSAATRSQSTRSADWAWARDGAETIDRADKHRLTTQATVGMPGSPIHDPNSHHFEAGFTGLGTSK